MDKEEGLVIEGVVVEAVKGGFRVQMAEENQSPNPEKPPISAHLSGKLRKNFIKIVVGDRVKVEVSPYDLTKGRIIYRMKE
jgi:translation initiation factor IF-1